MNNVPSEIFRQYSFISLQLNRIIPVFQIVFGTFGNIMNIMIFTRRSLRNNPCSLYFIASSIDNICVLLAATFTRLLSSGWNIDPSSSNVVLCKLRTFLVYTLLALNQWFLILASADRYLSSCKKVRMRNLSSMPIARKTIICTVLIMFLIHFHTLIWWSVDYIGSKTYCNIFSYNYEIAFQIFSLILTCILPPVLMTIFGILTIGNVRKIRRRIVPQNRDAVRHNCLRSKDRQMIMMLLIQVFVTIICTVPFAVANITTMIFQYLIPISSNGAAINYIFSEVSRLVNYFNQVVGFYIYTLSSQTFRREIKSCVMSTTRFILQRTDVQRRHLPTSRENTTGLFALKQRVDLKKSTNRTINNCNRIAIKHIT